MTLNTDTLNRTVFISDNLPFLKSLDNESVELVLIDPPFGKTQTFVGTLRPPLTAAERRVERELMESWGVVDEDSAFGAGLEYPDQTGTTAKFDDIWDFSRRIYKDWLDALEGVCPGAYWLIQSTRYTHGDGTAAYIAFMVERMLEVRRVLKPTGSVYLHCDHEANAYLRQMMDAVFGARNFQNEVIWQRTRAHSDSGRYGRNADTILFYSKGHRWTWNKQYQDYDEKYLKSHYRYKTADGRVYRTDNLTATGLSGGGYEYEWNGVVRIWRLPLERMEQLDTEGRIRHTRNGVAEYIRYLDEMPGVPLQTIWSDISAINSQAHERTGYPTQKPQALAKRIIEASSNPGDLVLDCFAGCAYVPVAAELTGRRWIACDMSPRAWTVVRRQFHKQSDLRIVTEGDYAEGEGVKPALGDRRVIHVRGPHELPVRTTGDGDVPMRFGVLPEPTYRQRPVEDALTIWGAFVKKWATQCWYCGTDKDKDRRELQLDHIEPNRRDGSNDDCWNRALACIACNSDKGNRLTPTETIDKALEAGRIRTPALRDEQREVFERRQAWACERWETVRPKPLPI